MRALFAALVATALLLGSQATHALSIDPDPVNQTRGGLDADVHLVSIAGDTMTVQVTVSSGLLLGLDVSMLFDDIDAPGLFSFVSSASTLAGTGDVGASALNFVTEAQFLFGAGIGAGQSSDQLVIQFDAPIALGWEGAFSLDDGLALDSTYMIVPEPGVALLLAGGLGMLAGARRRR